MTTEHLRPLLDDAHSTHLFFRLGENLARAQVPEVAAAAVRSGRMTALSKEDGGCSRNRDRRRGETVSGPHSTIGPSSQGSHSAPSVRTLHPSRGVSALLMPSRLCAD